MHHRGPDGAGAWRHSFRDDWHVCLLHTRLAIVDPDPRASQPMRRAGHVIAFNGEIYNYPELRQELFAQGHEFSTDSDTEVLLTGLARNGIVWLDRAEGMWAFACYQEANGQLSLSRDRFGEKPVHVWAADGGWYFSSEVKAIAALAGRWPEVDAEHVKRFLVNGYKSLFKTDATFFKDVAQVHAGSAVTLAPSCSPQEVRYWTATPQQDQKLTFEGAVTAVRDRLIESVRLRLRADVPIAFCMSGGVDSNALISIAKRVFDYDVHGFTVVNSDRRYEERAMVETVVRELGIRHTALPLDPAGFLPSLRRLVAQHDAPVLTLSYYVHWQLMRLVADHGYKISVSGTAADELFTGYFDHHNFYLAAVAADRDRQATALDEWARHVKPIVRNPYLADPDLFVRNPGFRDHIYLDAGEFSNYLATPWREDFAETQYVAEPLRNRMLNELFHESVPVILNEDDCNAMSWSVENRSPFLDRRLYEAAGTIPTRHLVRGGYAKAVLREAMRGIVPDAVIDNHRKVGFNAPIEDLMPLDAKETRDELLAPSPVFNIVRREAIEQLVSSPALPNSRSKFLFNFTSVKMFLEQGRAA